MVPCIFVEELWGGNRTAHMLELEECMVVERPADDALVPEMLHGTLTVLQVTQDGKSVLGTEYDMSGSW